MEYYIVVFPFSSHFPVNHDCGRKSTCLVNNFIELEWWTIEFKTDSDENPGYSLYIGDYTTHLYRNYNKQL